MRLFRRALQAVFVLLCLVLSFAGPAGASTPSTVQAAVAKVVPGLVWSACHAPAGAACLEASSAPDLFVCRSVDGSVTALYWHAFERRVTASNIKAADDQLIGLVRVFGGGTVGVRWLESEAEAIDLVSEEDADPIGSVAIQDHFGHVELSLAGDDTTETLTLSIRF